MLMGRPSYHNEFLSSLYEMCCFERAFNVYRAYLDYPSKLRIKRQIYGHFMCQDPNITKHTVSTCGSGYDFFEIFLDMNAVVFPAAFGVTKTQFERKSIE